MVKLKASSLPNKDERLVITNKVYMNPADCTSFNSLYVEITSSERDKVTGKLKRICALFE